MTTEYSIEAPNGRTQGVVPPTSWVGHDGEDLAQEARIAAWQAGDANPYRKAEARVNDLLTGGARPFGSLPAQVEVESIPDPGLVDANHPALQDQAGLACTRVDAARALATLTPRQMEYAKLRLHEATHADMVDHFGYAPGAWGAGICARLKKEMGYE